jgi:hypothetical protein
MSVNSKKQTLRIARAIIKQNDTATRSNRRSFKLRGPLRSRDWAVAKASALVATIRMQGSGRPWILNSALDAAVAADRKIARDTRLHARHRIKALIRLAIADGFLPLDDLDDKDPQDKYLCSLLAAATKPAQSRPPEDESEAEARVRINKLYGYKPEGTEEQHGNPTDSGSTPEDV